MRDSIFGRKTSCKETVIWSKWMSFKSGNLFMRCKLCMYFVVFNICSSSESRYEMNFIPYKNGFNLKS
jgi:hypothetical protein